MRDFKLRKLVANQKSPASVMQGGHDMYKEARVVDPHESETAQEEARAPPLRSRRKEMAMRFILALLLMSGTAMAQVQNRTYQDSMGRNTGRSVTDSRGNTTY